MAGTRGQQCGQNLAPRLHPQRGSQLGPTHAAANGIDHGKGRPRGRSRKHLPDLGRVIRPGAQTQAKVLVAVVLWEHRTAFCVKGEWISLLLLVGFRALGRHIDQDSFQRCLGLPHLTQRQQRRLTAFDTAFRRIYHPDLVGRQVETLLAVALVCVVHHQRARLLQAGAQHVLADEFSNTHAVASALSVLVARCVTHKVSSAGLFPSVSEVIAATTRLARSRKNSLKSVVSFCLNAASSRSS